MKRFLIALLVVFLFIDVFFGLSLFKPELITSIKNRVIDSKLTISSTMPDRKVSFSNKSYLSAKLNSIGFWNTASVRFYTKTDVERVTVNSLNVVLTDKVQSWGQRADSKSGNDILYSYGQVFDKMSGTMTLYIHLDPNFKSSLPISTRYSGVVLFALFDLLQPYPVTDHVGYAQRAKLFLSDLTIDPKKNNFIHIEKL